MLRFSDRLTSTASTSLEQVKTINAPSDETAIKSPSPTDQEYIALVELIGLHQTVQSFRGRVQCCDWRKLAK